MNFKPLGWPVLKYCIILLIVSAGISFWAAVERGELFPWHPGPDDTAGWQWRFLSTTQFPFLSVLFYGVILLGLPLVLRVGYLRIRRCEIPWHRLMPGWTEALALLAVVVCCLFLSKIETQRACVAAVLLIVPISRLCLLSIYWKAFGAEKAIRALCALIKSYPKIALAMCSIAPTLILGNVAVAVTGDEPSYLLYTASILHDGDFHIVGDELASAQRSLGLPPGFTAHTYSGGSFEVPPPLHFIGTSIALIPAYSLGVLFGAATEFCQALMLVLYGLTIWLSGWISIRITNRLATSIAAAVIIALSLPQIALSYQIYPEGFVTPLLLSGYLPLSGYFSRNRTPVTLAGACYVTLVCALLPWFHSKFAILSVILYLILFAVIRTQIKTFLLTLGIAALGALVFFGFHIPFYGDLLYKQNPMHISAHGLIGLLSNGTQGLLPYLSFAVFLPFGVRCLVRGGSSALAAVALLCPTVCFYLLTGCAGNWASGGDTALRYFGPVIVLWVPIIASALIAARGAVGLIFIASLAVPFSCAIAFIREPWSAYHATTQRSRVILDNAFAPFSWVDFFPHFQYFNNGFDYPERFAHGLVIILVFAIVAVSLYIKHRNRYCLPTVILGLAVMAFSGMWFQSPNWGTTAVRVFSRAANQWSGVAKAKAAKGEKIPDPEELVSRNKPLQFVEVPAGIRPVEVFAMRNGNADFQLRFPLHQAVPYEPLVGFKAGPLPRGMYKFAVNGELLGPETTMSRELILHVYNVAEGPSTHTSKHISSTTVSLQNRTDSGAILQELVHVPRSGNWIEFSLQRTTPFRLRMDKIQLSYFGRH